MGMAQSQAIRFARLVAFVIGCSVPSTRNSQGQSDGFSSPFFHSVADVRRLTSIVRDRCREGLETKSKDRLTKQGSTGPLFHECDDAIRPPPYRFHRRMFL